MKPFLHDRIYHGLLLEIASGCYSEYSRFLSLRKAAAIFRTSKPTIAIAFDRLCAEGVLVRAPRSGYRVAANARFKAMLVMTNQIDLQKIPAPLDWRYKRSCLQRKLRGDNLNLVVIYLDVGLPPHSGDDIYVTDENIHSLRCAVGCREAALRNNVKINFFCFDGDPDRLIRLKDILKATDFDGGIVIQRSPMIQNFVEIVSPLLKKGVPVLNLFGEHNCADVISMDFNNVSAGYRAVRILAERGIEKVVILTSAGTDPSGAARTEGSRAGRDFGLDVESHVCDFSHQTVGLTISFLKNERFRKIGFISCFHEGALAVKRLCDQAHYNIPEQISLICFTSFPHLPDIGFSFDAMKLDFDKIGFEAVQTMVRMLNGEAVHRCTLLEMDYVSKGTVG